jgi:hypothetical protein
LNHEEGEPVSEVVVNRLEKKDLSCESILPTDHGVNYVPIGSAELFRHMRGRRVRRWLITETCRNCPDHFRVRSSVDSKQSLLKDMARARCTVCLEDRLEFFMQDLRPARDDEPCVSLNGEVWR